MNYKHIEKTHTLQLDQSDCGVACLMSIIKLYGGNNSLEKLRELSGTSKQGTTMLGLYQAANQVGFTAEGCEANIKALIEHKQPVILHLIIDNRLQHYVVCYEYHTSKGFLIGDPAKGLYFLKETVLDRLWVSKSCLTLEINANFVKDAVLKSSQKKWFLTILNDDLKLLWISVLLGVFVAGLGMSMSLFSQKMIDDILPSYNLRKLILGIILLTILLIARTGISVLREYFLLQQSKNFNNRINSLFFSSLLHLPKPFFDTRKIGDLVARLNDTQRVQRVLKILASNFVIDLLVTIISLGFLFSYSWMLGVISLFSLPIYFYIIYRSNGEIINSQKNVMQSYAINESNYINTIQGISAIKNDNKQIIFSNLNHHLFSNFQDKIYLLGKLNIKLSWQSGIASVCFLIGVLIYTSIQVFNKNIKLGELMAILGIVNSLLPSIANLALISIPIQEAKIALDRMYEFTSIDKENNDGLHLELIENIKIQNLSFRFVGRSQLIFDASIEIKRGKVTAIIGESGSGKSTIGQILQRFYNFESGQIIINNKYQLNDIQLDKYRELVGVVPQEIIIFNGNVLDNILLGETGTSEDIFNFLQVNGFDVYFNSLPQGLDTILGEEGINLSGGQKQIIALARALYKKPDFLILDEATAAMDRNTEFFTIKLLEKIKPKCAVFFISHRINLLRKFADIIYILENKTITEFGSHDDLMKNKNFYSNYWNNES